MWCRPRCSDKLLRDRPYAPDCKQAPLEAGLREIDRTLEVLQQTIVREVDHLWLERQFTVRSITPSPATPPTMCTRPEPALTATP